MSEQTISIAGRLWRGIEASTAENDVWNQGLIAQAELGRLAMLEGESADEFALRTYRKLAFQSDVFLLLGGMIIPAELATEDWTPDIARQSAALFRKCTDAEDKRAIQAQIVSMVMGFLSAGLISVRLFPKSSSQAAGTPVSRNPIAVESPSESGAESSEPSPEKISTGDGIYIETGL